MNISFENNSRMTCPSLFLLMYLILAGTLHWNFKMNELLWHILIMCSTLWDAYLFTFSFNRVESAYICSPCCSRMSRWWTTDKPVMAKYFRWSSNSMHKVYSVIKNLTYELCNGWFQLKYTYRTVSVIRQILNIKPLT